MCQCEFLFFREQRRFSVEEGQSPTSSNGVAQTPFQAKRMREAAGGSVPRHTAVNAVLSSLSSSQNARKRKASEGKKTDESFEPQRKKATAVAAVQTDLDESLAPKEPEKSPVVSERYQLLVNFISRFFRKFRGCLAVNYLQTRKDEHFHPKIVDLDVCYGVFSNFDPLHPYDKGLVYTKSENANTKLLLCSYPIC